MKKEINKSSIYQVLNEINEVSHILSLELHMSLMESRMNEMNEMNDLRMMGLSNVLQVLRRNDLEQSNELRGLRMSDLVLSTRVHLIVCRIERLGGPAELHQSQYPLLWNDDDGWEDHNWNLERHNAN